MKTQSVAPRRWLLGALFLIIILLTACSGRSETWPGIAASPENDAVVVSFRKTVVSLSPDKTRNWTYPDKDNRKADFYAPAIIDDGIVYIGDYKGGIHAVDVENGQGLWTYEPKYTTFLGFKLGASDRVIGPITLGEGKLFFGNEHGVVALDITGESPRELWSFETNHSIWAQMLYVNDASLDIPPTLFVASLDQHVYALNPADGSKHWSIDLKASIPGGITLDTQRQLLYVGTLGSELVALDLEGNIVDTYKTEGWLWGTPTLFDNKLYFGDLKGYLYELHLTDGDEVFGDVFKRQLSPDPLRASPLIVEGLLDSGETEGEDNDTASVENVPVLVIGSQNGRVYALDLADTNWIRRGENGLRWTKTLEGKTVTDLAWLDLAVVAQDGQNIEQERLVIVGTEQTDRLVVALRLNDGGSQVWSYKYDD